MKTGSIYEKASGRILMTVVAPEEEAVRLQVTNVETQSILFDTELDGRDMYVIDGKPEKRPSMSLKVEVDGVGLASDEAHFTTGQTLSVSNIPSGTILNHPGGETVIDDGFIEWSSLEPGNFTFHFSNFPYKEVTIDAIVR